MRDSYHFLLGNSANWWLFSDLIVYIYILRFQQILLYYMEHNEYGLVMETCKRHG